MTEVPRVSIVVAAFNVAPYLRRCVTSLLGQTEELIEVILVDDGSTDETPSLVDRFGSDDHRIRAIHRQNGGLSAARNTGLNAAKGEFVCFIDGDDWVEPNMVKSMISWCESTSSHVAIAGVHVDFHDLEDHVIRSDRRILMQHQIRRGVPLAIDVCDDNFVNLLGYAWNKIYRRDWLLRLGIQFEEGLSLVEDIDFNAKVLGAAERVVLVPDAFVHYVQRPRLTLGTTYDETLLAKRLRAIDSVGSLLETWGVDRAKRVERTAYASGMALWTALRFVVTSPRPKDQLRELVEQPAAERLISLARARPSADWRSFWATTTLMRHWYGVALLPVYASQALNGLGRLYGRGSKGELSASI